MKEATEQQSLTSLPPPAFVGMTTQVLSQTTFSGVYPRNWMACKNLACGHSHKNRSHSSPPLPIWQQWPLRFFGNLYRQALRYPKVFHQQLYQPPRCC